jgi:hypothetical protein
MKNSANRWHAAALAAAGLFPVAATAAPSLREIAESMAGPQHVARLDSPAHRSESGPVTATAWIHGRSGTGLRARRLHRALRVQ